MAIYCLSDSWPWFGEHQCYSRLIPYLKALVKDRLIEIRTRRRALNRIRGRMVSFLRGDFSRRDSVFSDAEWRFWLSARFKTCPENLYHVLFYDVHYRMFRRGAKLPPNFIVTLHHPIGRAFPPGMEERIRCLSSAIVMFSEGVEYFENYLGKGRVKFIPHGVDTEFFRPGDREKKTSKGLFFTGQNGRNVPMLVRVVLKLASKYPDLKAHILVSEKIQRSEAMRPLRDCPAVLWHENLNEEAVRSLYQQSAILLMPMDGSGVNNAIVEALACALPVVTTDVGGVRDYGGGSVYPVVANNDDDGMVRLVERYFEDAPWQGEVARNCRRFAEENLAWPLAAKRHLEAYRELSSGASPPADGGAFPRNN